MKNEIQKAVEKASEPLMLSFKKFLKWAIGTVWFWAILLLVVVLLLLI